MTLHHVTVTDDLNVTIPLPSTYRIKTPPSATGTLAANASFNGNNNHHLLDSVISILDTGTTETIRFTVSITPNDFYGPFVNSAIAKAIGAGLNSVVRDTSQIGNNPDPNGNNNPLDSDENKPTPIVLTPLAPIIGIAKSASATKRTLDGKYDVTYTLIISNLSDISLSNVSISDNLKNTIISPSRFSVVGNISATGQLSINNGFNGSTDTLLLIASQSNMAINQTDTLSFTVRIEPNNFYGPYYNTAFAYATDSLGVYKTKDASQDGHSPDPNGDRIPSEQTPTIVKITLQTKEKIRVPNGFSPNDDGDNDAFFIDNPDGYTLHLSIYNRWGNLLYDNENYDNSWNGKAEKGIVVGDGVPDGTYFYVIEYVDHSGEIVTKNGFVTISR